MKKIKTKHVLIGIIILIWFGEPLLELISISIRVGLSIFIPFAFIVIVYRTFVWTDLKTTNQTTEKWWEYVKPKKHNDEEED